MKTNEVFLEDYEVTAVRFVLSIAKMKIEDLQDEIRSQLERGAVGVNEDAEEKLEIYNGFVVVAGKALKRIGIEPIDSHDNNLFCPNCNAQVNLDANFCIECGKKLKNDASPELIENNTEFEYFSPKGTLDDFKKDMGILQKFAQETTKMIDSTTILLAKDENLDDNLNTNLLKIKNEINIKKKELNSKLKVLNSDLIFINILKDENDPQLIKIDINIDEEELMRYVEFYKTQ